MMCILSVAIACPVYNMLIIYKRAHYCNNQHIQIYNGYIIYFVIFGKTINTQAQGKLLFISKF